MNRFNKLRKETEVDAKFGYYTEQNLIDAGHLLFPIFNISVMNKTSPSLNRIYNDGLLTLLEKVERFKVQDINDQIVQ